MARPRADDYGDKRRRVLVAAAEQFARLGYAATTMVDIAKACGIAKSVVYHYYESKPLLLSDIVREHAREIRDAAERALASESDPERRFRALVRALMEIYVARPAEQAVLNNERVHLRGKPLRDAAAAQKELVALVADALAALDPSPDFGEHDARVAALVFFGAINWTYTWFDAKGRLSARDLADRIADLHLVGLRRSARPVAGAPAIRTGTAGAPRADLRLDGRVIMLTGAARGLGFEMARALAQAGAHVIINGRDSGRLDAAAAAIRDEGGDVSTAVFDAMDVERAADIVTALAARHGRLDGFINNVGQRNRKSLLDLSLPEIRQQIETNLVDAMWLARAAAQAMLPRKAGRIVNVTSLAARMAVAPDASYVASKGGLEAVTHALAYELGPHNITVNAIAPGFFATETNARMAEDPAIGPRFGNRTALRRWGRPHEIAGAAVFLCSEAASFVTGHTLVVDGGTSVTSF